MSIDSKKSKPSEARELSPHPQKVNSHASRSVSSKYLWPFHHILSISCNICGVIYGQDMEAGRRVSIKATHFGKAYAKEMFGKEWKTAIVEGVVRADMGMGMWKVLWDGDSESMDSSTKHLTLLPEVEEPPATGVEPVEPISEAPATAVAVEVPCTIEPVADVPSITPIGAAKEAASKMTVAQLKVALELRGAKKSGTKPVLLARLVKAIDGDISEDESSSSEDDDNEVDPDSMSSKDLRAELLSRGLSKDGTKKTLVKRLKESIALHQHGDADDDSEPLSVLNPPKVVVKQRAGHEDVTWRLCPDGITTDLREAHRQSASLAGIPAATLEDSYLSQYIILTTSNCLILSPYLFM